MLAPAHLADVYQTFYARCYLYECAVVSHHYYLAMNLVAYFEVRIKRIPRVRSELLQAESNAFLLLVKVKDNHIDLLIQLYQLVRIVDTTPAQVGDVDQTVYAAQVDEHTVVGDVLDGTFQYLSFLEFRNDLFLLCLQLSLDKCFVGNNDITEVRINFYNLELHGLAYEYVVVADRLNVNLAARQECLHTQYINDHTALGAALDVSGNDLLLLASLINAVPSLSSASLFVRKHELALLVLLALDINLYLVAYLEVGIVTELCCRYDTVRLVAYVHYDLAFVDRDNCTFYNLLVLDGVKSVVVLFDFFFVFCALLLCFIGIPVEVLERKIFCHCGR